MTSPARNSNSMNNIPSVSSFIKNSDDLLHRTSPTSQEYAHAHAHAQHNQYTRCRLSSESELAPGFVDQRRHTSMVGSAIDERDAMLSVYQRTRSASLSAEKCSLPSTSPNMCRSTPNLPLVQQPCSPIVPATNPQFCIKTEVAECSPTGWISNGVPYNENVPPTNHYCKSEVNSRFPTSLDDSFVALNQQQVVPKQEKFYLERQYEQATPHTCLSMAPDSLQTATQPFFPPRQINFPSIVDPQESSSLNHPSPALPQNRLPHATTVIEERYRPGDLCPRRTHPYLQMAVNSNLAMAVNGTTPYRPRFSRRNNPDLEKKRIHKCTHTGRHIENRLSHKFVVLLRHFFF